MYLLKYNASIRKLNEWVSVLAWKDCPRGLNSAWKTATLEVIPEKIVPRDLLGETERTVVNYAGDPIST